MKHIILLFFIIYCLFNAPLKAQNYRTIRSGSEMFYKSPKSDPYRGIRIDSVAVTGSDTLLFNYRHMRRKSNHSYCSTPYGASWIGLFIMIQPNGTNIFFNKDNDSIFISTLARLGDSWRCYTYPDGKVIKGFITDIDTATFLGITDSVKTVTLKLYDSSGINILDDSLFTLKLSKHYGLVSTLNFWVFPDLGDMLNFDWETPQEYVLAGLTNPDSGWQNMTAKSIYDYEVGDEIHERVLRYDDRFSYDYEINKKVLTKMEINDTLAYDIEYTTLSLYIEVVNSKPVYRDSTYRHYTKKFVVNFPYLDGLPEEPIIDETARRVYPYQVTDNQKIMPQPLLYSSIDSCAGAPTDQPSFYYVKGVGGEYFDASGSFAMIDYFLPVYYKKGSKTWGRPLYIKVPAPPDSTPPPIEEQPAAIPSFNIYPTPAHNQLTIEPGELKISSFAIFDSYGVLVLQSHEAITGKKDIDISQLSNGIYVLKLIHDQGQHVQKILVK